MLPTLDTGNLLKSTFDFLPELILCVGIVALLFCRLLKVFDRTHLGDKGARLFSTMVAQALLRLLPTLAPHFKPEQETTNP